MQSSRGRWSLAGVVLCLVLLGAGACSKASDVGTGASVPTSESQSSGNQPSGEKKVFKQDQTDIKVVAGETFAIRLPQNPSIGDDWKLISAPDDSFVKEDGSSMKYDSSEPKPGEGGQIEFKFKAKKPGGTTVTLFNCYRCGGPGTTVSPDNSQYAKRITFTITVS